MPDMNASGPYAILILNAGSSSIKFGIYHAATLEPLLTGQVRGFNEAQASFTFAEKDGQSQHEFSPEGIQDNAIMRLCDWLENRIAIHSITLRAVAYRIVSGMRHSVPALITPEVLADIGSGSVADPEHTAASLELIHSSMSVWPHVSHIAISDSAFHSTLPDRSRVLPLPEKYRKLGLQRYGFHGISYASIMTQIKNGYGQSVHDSRIIIAHLGNGASLAAVAGGRSMDTTMSYSPTGGIPMSTRSGDLDPAAVLYMLREGTHADITNLLNNESGLKAISGSTGDINILLRNIEDDPGARAAVEYFCYHVRKAIGSLAAALGGTDVLVFTGGIGEHLPEIRIDICEGLGYMGVKLDSGRNENNERELSVAGQKPMVLLLPSQEEAAMARILHDFLNGSI